MELVKHSVAVGKVSVPAFTEMTPVEISAATCNKLLKRTLNPPSCYPAGHFTRRKFLSNWLILATPIGIQHHVFRWVGYCSRGGVISLCVSDGAPTERSPRISIK